MVDLLSLFRDILLVQLGSEVEAINLEIMDRVRAAAGTASPVQTLATLDAIATARRRIDNNVAPVLALEAMLITARRGAA